MCAIKLFLSAILIFAASVIASAPASAKFLSTDPIGYEDQMNLYAYVGNDPMNATDPSGEQTVLQHILNRDGGAKMYDSQGNIVATYQRGTMTNAGIPPTAGVMTVGGVTSAAVVGCVFGGCQAVGAGSTAIMTNVAVRAPLLTRAGTAATGIVLEEVSGPGVGRMVVGRIPGAVNSTFGKLDYLLGRVPTPKSVGKGGFFGDFLGFSDDTLDVALKQHLVNNIATGSRNSSGFLEVTGEMVGPNGVPAQVKSVWQSADDITYDLITAQPAPRK